MELENQYDASHIRGKWLIQPGKPYSSPKQKIECEGI